jgi:hypothetical protein
MIVTPDEENIIIKYLKDTDSKYFIISPLQRDKIKSIWKALHHGDDKHIYTFSDDFTVLRKEDSPFVFPSTINPFHKPKSK